MSVNELTTKQEILEDVVKEEIDYITYVDVATEEFHIITIKEDGRTHLPQTGNYTEVNKESIPKYVHPGDVEYCEQQFALQNLIETLEKKDRVVMFYRVLCGEEYRRKSMNVYYHNGDKSRLILVRRDVNDSFETEQRQRERLYYALMDARHANQEKNEFLERMSHEIRTPMNSIIGLSYLTREHVDHPKQVLENLDKINMSAHFLLSFINDILNLSQIESGNIALIQEDTYFDDFLEGLRRGTAEKAEKKKITFSMQKRGNLDQEYCFDAEKLGKALHNILDNAVKFTLPDGRVDFIVEVISEGEKDATIRFEIRDNGVGIDENFLPYVFTPFEQEGSGNTTLNGGTGLGLAIARNIIDFMDGKIDVYSEKGKGSTFVVTVALERVEDMEESIRKQNKSEALDYDFSGKRVLLVEDNEINIEITKNILTHKNFEVEVAVNGEEGVSMFLEHEPGYYDVILMDVRMPVMDGLTATRKIRESGHMDSSRIPIVAMTANAFEEDVRKSFEAGMDAHLSKPVDIKQIYSVLDSMICG